MTGTTEAIQTLHTTLIDSRNGYQEALEDAEEKGLTDLFKEMIALRNADISDVASILRKAGVQPDSSGSFMTTVHKTVISIRSIIVGLHKDMLPSLVSGEERILKTYDDAIDASPNEEARNELVAQRAKLHAVVERMRRMSNEAASEASS
jgi:uncharacterized protein (TIGR02284 family)